MATNRKLVSSDWEDHCSISTITIEKKLELIDVRTDSRIRLDRIPVVKTKRIIRKIQIIHEGNGWTTIEIRST